MDILGKSPIPLHLLILGKLAFAGCWLFFIVKFLALDTMLYDSAVTRPIGVALFVCGGALALLALVHQGTRMTRKKWIHADKEESSRFKDKGSKVGRAQRASIASTSSPPGRWIPT